MIVPNYLQASSNCIVATAQYHICCANHCERLLGKLEVAVRSASATVEDILAAVEARWIGPPPQSTLRTMAPLRLSPRVPFSAQSWHCVPSVGSEYTGVVEVVKHVREEIGAKSGVQASEHEDHGAAPHGMDPSA